MDPDDHAHPIAGPTCLLAFGTSTDWCCVGLLWRDAVGRLRCDALAERAGQEHSRRVLAMAGALLRGAGLELSAVEAIAFDAGPGSFTGLRIGCGIAQGLAFALGRPVVPVASLEALALQADAETALVALDARMGEVYCAAYRVDRGGATALGPLRVLAPEEAASQLLAHLPGREVHGVVAIGNAFARQERLGSAVADRGVAIRNDPCPRADAIAAAGWRRLARGDVVDAARAAPLYVRDKVALDVDEQRRARAQRAAAPVAADGGASAASAGRG